MLPIANPVRPSQCPCRAGELAGDEARVASRGSARQHAAGQQQRSSGLSGLSADKESALESLGRTQQAELAGLRAQVPMRPSMGVLPVAQLATISSAGCLGRLRAAAFRTREEGPSVSDSHREAVAVEPGRA